MPVGITSVDLADETALRILRDNVTVIECHPKKLFYYSKMDEAFRINEDQKNSNPLKKGIDWTGIQKHRQVLSDLLEASQGRMINQKKWCGQVASFLQGLCIT